MPVENNFQHDELSRKSPGERLAVTALTAEPPTDSPEWTEAMARHGQTMSRAGVRMVVFLHGAIRGTDVFGAQRLDEAGGLKRGYSRGVSGLDALLAAMREETNGIPLLPGDVAPPLSNDEATKKVLDERLALMREMFQKTPLALNVAYISWGEDAVWAPLGWQGMKRK